jgi:ABC-2 type transport system ATP-binding protein
MPALEFQSVTKQYGSRPALADFSLAVNPGEVFGLLGPNGAGKTTALKVLLNFVQPTAGRAFIDGRPADDPQSRRSVGYLPENPVIPGRLTAVEFLNLQAGLAGLTKDEREARVRAGLARLKLEGNERVPVSKFSKGMVQRLGLAAALLARPRLLVLDEPSSGLDPHGIHEVRVLLEEMQAGGATIFLNSHLLSEVEKICTRAAIISRGRLVAHDSVKNLCREGETLENAFLRLVPE